MTETQTRDAARRQHVAVERGAPQDRARAVVAALQSLGYSPDRVVIAVPQRGPELRLTLGDVAALVRAAAAARPAHTVSPAANLTPRMRNILPLLAEARSTQQIATQLRLDISTVKTHLRRMFKEYGVHSRSELVMTAVRRGDLIITPTGD